MDQKTVQKLHKAIEARVRAEVAYHESLHHGQTAPLSEHLKITRRVKRHRQEVSRILDREFDPVMHDKVLKAQRKAYAGSLTAEGFLPVQE